MTQRPIPGERVGSMNRYIILLTASILIAPVGMAYDTPSCASSCGTNGSNSPGPATVDLFCDPVELKPAPQSWPPMQANINKECIHAAPQL